MICDEYVRVTGFCRTLLTPKVNRLLDILRTGYKTAIFRHLMIQKVIHNENETIIITIMLV